MIISMIIEKKKKNVSEDFGENEINSIKCNATFLS